MEAVYEIDNNRYAFLFDREVFRYFTEYVLNQPADRLKWGYGRIIHHENLYDLVVSLKKKDYIKFGIGTKSMVLLRIIASQQKYMKI